MLKKIQLYFHTIRYLKLSQLYWQCVRRIYHPKISFDVDLIKLTVNSKKWTQSIKNKNPVFKNGFITFLNQSLLFDQNVWQTSKTQSKLWQYNLNYFQGLLSDDQHTVMHSISLLNSWVESCSPDTKIAWEPYPIAVRIGNTIKFSLNGGVLSPDVMKSLYCQARLLYKIPEYQLLGNHLLEDAKALIFAGKFFEGSEPKKWFQLGMKILRREIPRQILDDGGCFELSPMYHALMLELMLDLYNFFTAYQIMFPNNWLNRIQKMRYWLKVMTHPDDQISFFNDSALGITASPSELEYYAKRLNLPDIAEINEECIHLKESGFIRLQNNKMVAILDCAKIGPDYQPAHAHADTLSFELSIGKKRCIVNSGTSVYADDIKLREWQRCTASHSTVEINNMSSSEPWGVFRVARRAYPADLKIQKSDDGWMVSCSHTGYKKTHKRIWKMSEKEFSVVDDVNTKLPAISRFYLHPDIKISLIKSQNQTDEDVTVNANQEMHLRDSAYYPEFGKVTASKAIEICFAESCSVQFAISDNVS